MKIGNRKGFSLIEIGIVMVVIGLIIAAVMKGKDVIKSAEMKQNNQAYFNKWVNVADGYYDKTQLFLDVNVTDSTDTGAVPAANLQNAVAAVNAAGLNHPNPKVQLSGEATENEEVTVWFQKNATITSLTLNRNITCFNNVPGDIAISYDRLVDGVADGEKGVSRIVGVTTTAGTIAPVAALTGININTVSAASTYDICRIHEHAEITPPQAQ